MKTYQEYITEITWEKRKELEYELRHETEQTNDIKAIGMYMYRIPPGQEDIASSLAIKKTKNGKFGMIKYNKSGRSFMYRKQLADKEFGEGYWVEFK
ncbi:MAG: hypothetical protein PHC28_07875 [Flavobacterium sp.]|uniref:hypothetical protein n=1 Tax=Flavobacterium sp. TaxID=239 RepID=UPI002635FA30|nr:hypothetical protein [Flavobacterium sp.]MDD5150390.1 hypothetical protein [Flavobacterium sp.]